MHEKEKDDRASQLAAAINADRQLYPEQILAWVEIYREQNEGKFPSQGSGPVLDEQGKEIGENWRAINTAFRQGLRGLKGSGVGSLKEFLDSQFADDRVAKEDLTEKKILEWVEIYRERNGSRFPSVNSGPVLDEQGQDIGETWKAIDTAFRKGNRGLKYSACRSLSDLLDDRYQHERIKKEDLTEEKLLEWVKIYRKQNDGEFPSVKSGVVLDEQCQDAGETWKAIMSALRKGHRGLGASGVSSISEFLVKHFPDDRIGKEDLTEEKLLEWVAIYREQNDGKFPSVESGEVLDEFGHETGESWVAINAALKLGLRGLKGREFCSLAEFLDERFPEDRINYLTEGRLLEWVKIYRKLNDGKFPSQGSGPVLDERGQEIGETWVAIKAAFRLGLRGLKGSGYHSLSEFLDKKFPDERIAKGKLTEDEVLEWVKIYRKQNGGKFPSVESGSVLDEQGHEIGESWKRIDGALRQGLRGLKGCNHKSLSQLLDAHFPERKANQNSVQKPQADTGINYLLDLIDQSSGDSDA